MVAPEVNEGDWFHLGTLIGSPEASVHMKETYKCLRCTAGQKADGAAPYKVAATAEATLNGMGQVWVKAAAKTLLMCLLRRLRLRGTRLTNQMTLT